MPGRDGVEALLGAMGADLGEGMRLGREGGAE